MSRAQYDALIAAGAAGNSDEVYRLRDLIDDANSITRYVLWISWQDVGGQAPPRAQQFQETFPPGTLFKLELERSIARSDVDTVLETQAANPVGVLVTPDPNGVVGWTALEDYDFVAGAT